MPDPVIRIRINHIDWTLIDPDELDHAPASLLKVPVIRIYGQTSLGRNACVHVHQVYPYFYIDYLGSLEPRAVKQYIRKLEHSLNRAIAISLKRTPNQLSIRYIRAIVLIKGVHLYGFHHSYAPFLKIYIADPNVFTRAVALLNEGTIMGSRFRIYESHLNFTLQFMCDFGLHGCEWLDINQIYLRDLQHDPGQDVISIPFSYKQSSKSRETRLAFEMDAIAPQILNRHSIKARNIHNALNLSDGLEGANDLGPLIQSVRELWTEERRRRTNQGLSPTPDLPLLPSEGSRSGGGDWASEKLFWEEIDRRVAEEALLVKADVSADQNWVIWVMNAFESIEALWAREWREWFPTDADGARIDHVSNPFERELVDDYAEDYIQEIDVDEEQLLNEDIHAIIENREQEFIQGLQQDFYDLQGENADNEDDGFFSIEDDDSEDGPEEDILGEGFEDSRLLIQTTDNEQPLGDPFSLDTSYERPRQFVTLWGRATSRESSVGGSVDENSNTIGNAGNSEVSDEDPFLVSDKTSPSHILSDMPILHEVTLKREQNLAAHPYRNELSGSCIGHDISGSVLDLVGDNSLSKKGPKSSLFENIATDRDPSKLLGCDLGHFLYSISSPKSSYLMEYGSKIGLPSRVYPDPFYSKLEDIPNDAQEFGGLWYEPSGSDGVSALGAWEPPSLFDELSTEPEDDLSGSPVLGGWEFGGGPCPPGRKAAARWLLRQNKPHRRNHLNDISQIRDPTAPNTHEFPAGQQDPHIPDRLEHRHMSIMSLETFAPSHSSGAPKSSQDAIAFIAYSFEEGIGAHASDKLELCKMGIVAVENCVPPQPSLSTTATIELVEDELSLIYRAIDLTIALDPDILVGWDVQRSSWGYLNDRARESGLELSDAISRAPERISIGNNDQWQERHLSTFTTTGRHVLNTWRIMRSEIKSTSYTLENIAFLVLRNRIPRYSLQVMSSWYTSHEPHSVWRAIRYVLTRTATTLEILERCGVITKSIEFAKICGVDFFSVFSRGSQFKVESFMVRLAKPESLILLSPNKADVGKQNAAECIPLIMEPQAAFYKSPIVVLDFQSLYPSMMIAYNYCYTTCVGRIQPFQGSYKLGVLDQLNQPVGMLAALRDFITVAPNGILYVKPSVRKGLLGRMLTELLNTRVMVKEAMKLLKEDKHLSRVFEARQASLKFVCNVTYGYTSATFSGRMPAVEVADSIVQSGRETVEKALALIESVGEWGAKVVYGDTDSLFVSLPGKTKEEAFKIGNDIASTITSRNPAPVRLKFEKVYFPCVLLAKKRYVGFKYDSIEQVSPVFDAKGIETIRRDGIPAQSKMVETALKILFRTKDLSQVKGYCVDSWTKILEERASLRDFIFAKEVKIGTYSEKVPPPPGATVALRRKAADEVDDPQYAERVPYVIVRGEPGTRLVDRAFSPEEFLSDRNKRLDTEYYISKVLIPPLERIFNLVGADIRAWYEDMPRPQRIDADLPVDDPDMQSSPPSNEAIERLMLNGHFSTGFCLSCGIQDDQIICMSCQTSPRQTFCSLLSLLRDASLRLAGTSTICRSCCHCRLNEDIGCVSLECPWFYQRAKTCVEVDLLTEIVDALPDVLSTHFEVNSLASRTL